MSNKRRTWIFLSSGILVMSCGYLSYWLNAYRNYDKTFNIMADAAVPKLGELNNQVLSELHPPFGVELIQQSNIEPWTPLGTRDYFVYLYADYEINEAKPEEITAYYQNLLRSTGWVESQFDLNDKTPDNHYHFYRDSASIEFSTYYSQYMQKYTLAIWHDFWKQDFSPPMPSNNIKPIWCNLHPFICR